MSSRIKRTVMARGIPMTPAFGMPEHGLTGSLQGTYAVEGVGPKGPHTVVGEGQSWAFWRCRRGGFGLEVCSAGDVDGGTMVVILMLGTREGCASEERGG